MNFRLLAVSVAMGLLFTVALYLFAPHTPEKQRTDAEHQAALRTFINRPGAMQDWLETCLPLFMPQLSDAKYEGALLSTQTAKAEDVCRRVMTFVADGRLTMSEINSHEDGLPFEVLEEAGRRPVPVAR